MALELAEIAAGLPFVASLAMATGITAFREGRRRTSINEAMHELRRPLQVLAFSLPADPRAGEAVGSALEMAAAAVDRLDREINGGGPSGAFSRVRMRSLIESAVGRWHERAASEGRPLRLVWRGGDAELQADETELAQAVDNLISNAFEHGRGGVVVEARERDGRLCLAVCDEGGRNVRAGQLSGPRRRRRPAGRAHHGHGLRIVRRVAGRHGGSFRLVGSAGGSEARLDLPLAGARR